MKQDAFKWRTLGFLALLGSLGLIASAMATQGHSHSDDVTRARTAEARLAEFEHELAAEPRIQYRGNRNPIDRQLQGLWTQKGMVPAKSASDAEFLRRVTLDILGRVPTLPEQRAFSKSPDRARWIDRLLRDKGFAKFWAERLASQSLGYALGGTGHDKTSLAGYFEDALEQEIGYDRMVYAIFASQPNPFTGANRSDPGAFLGHYTVDTDNARRLEELISRTSRVFLGENLHCAQCHDHPHPLSVQKLVDAGKAQTAQDGAITQDEFYGMVAFFSQLEITDQGIRDANKIVYEPEGYEKPLAPRFIDGTVVDASVDPRRDFAKLLTESPLFARTYANRVWSYFFGRGIVEPLDNIGHQVPPLLNMLGQEMEERNFNLRRLIRLIANSQAYQTTSAETTEAAAELFAAQRVRLLTPEQLFYALASATDLKRVYAQAELPEEAAYTRRFEQGFDFIKQLFVEAVTSTADFEATSQYPEYSANFHQFLTFLDIESIFFAGIEADYDGRLGAIMNRHEAPEDIITAIYRSALARAPNEREINKSLAYFREHPQLEEAYEDIFWAVLTTNEFFFNH